MKNRSKQLILQIGENRFEFNSVNNGMDALRKLGIKFGKKCLNQKSGNIIGRHFVDGKWVSILIPYEQPQYKPHNNEMEQVRKVVIDIEAELLKRGYILSDIVISKAK